MEELHGTVEKGKGRGKKLGFPTANIPLSITMDEGIYVSLTKVMTTWYPSVTFIGAAKTYEETDVHAETYIFDFDDDLYGKHVSIRLLEKIRDNKKFSKEEDLVEQMQKDVAFAKGYLVNYKYV